MDKINIKLPAKPDYVSAMRLTTSGIANRMGFNIEEVEDLKVAVSESIIFLLNQFRNLDLISIDYKIEEAKSLTIRIKIEESMQQEIVDKPKQENELGLFIIESISDKVTKIIENDIIIGFIIYKAYGGQ